MAEFLSIAEGNKDEKYKVLLNQLNSLLIEDDYLLSSMSNLCSILKMTFNFFWVGFYIVKDKCLYLGPFQGDLACTVIPYSKGVCGLSFSEKKTIIVPNVNEFPGHIACSSKSKSEIVIPLISNSQVLAVLDIDSDKLNDFDNIDKEYLEKIMSNLTILIEKRDSKLSLF